VKTLKVLSVGSWDLLLLGKLEGEIKGEGLLSLESREGENTRGNGSDLRWRL
jgi:hypothetical protein